MPTVAGGVTGGRQTQGTDNSGHGTAPAIPLPFKYPASDEICDQVRGSNLARGETLGVHFHFVSLAHHPNEGAQTKANIQSWLKCLDPIHTTGICRPGKVCMVMCVAPSCK